MKIEVSNGEIMDKLAIISIKLERITDPGKLANLKKEYDELKLAAINILPLTDPLYQSLVIINQELWEIEDRIRQLEKEQDFGEEFIRVARSVYQKNDERFQIKSQINQQTSSAFTEEKSYKS
jgi:hypothetical protein